MNRTSIASLLVVFIFFSCTDVQDSPPSVSTEIPPKQSIPKLDRSKHSVPLQHILFDTFGGTPRILPLTEASEEQILTLRDAIPPLHNPEYQTAQEVKWLKPEDLVVGYTHGKEAWAFPTKILNFHEIVNDEFDGQPLCVTYCPLCRSGIVYSREVANQIITFGNTSALYESAMVMLDYETGSYWWQVGGNAIAGTLTGEELSVLPSTTTTWSAWKEMHPSTKVLSWYTGYMRDYNRDGFQNMAQGLNQGNFSFPVSNKAMDDRLPLGAEVLVVRVGDEVKAYPIERIGNDAVQDSIGDQDVVIFVHADERTAAAFDPVVDGHRLTFEMMDGAFQDNLTQSVWNMSGKAVMGEWAGKSLRQLPSKYMFWFAAAASELQIEVYQS